MNKKILIALLMASGVLTNVQAKEPTIDVTYNFIQKILKNKKISKPTYSFEDRTNISYRTKDKCKLTINEGDSYPSGAKDKDKWYIDLSKQKMSYKYYDGKGTSNHIIVEDRQKIDTIICKCKRISDRGRTSRFTREQSTKDIYFKVNGVYKEKLNKALQHLSNKCYEKYGVKNNEPF